MIPNPIHKVLSTLSSHEVKHLLMGGQACVFYGAAEFSRDCDIVIVADPPNLLKLTAAIKELQAECIAVPPMEWEHLGRGHAIHFRCGHPDAKGIRLDIMTKMRGCGEFESLWEQRVSIEDENGFVYELLGIEDLVKAKKTQREKDWPMIRRLVDAHYDEFCEAPTDDRIRFWLRECRSPEILIMLAESSPRLLSEMHLVRPLLSEARSGNEEGLNRQLELEKKEEMKIDAEYWRPLMKELEAMRFEKRNK